MSYAQLPNILSIGRMLLVFPIVWALLNLKFGLAASLFVVAGISDGLDGFLAKRFSWQSRLGSILDPLADKLLLISTLISLAWLSLLPQWLVWLAVGRDLFIVLGGVVYHYCVARFSLVPIWSSKFNTTAQIMLVILVIAQQLSPVFTDAAGIFVWLVMATVLISGSEYIVVWGLKAWQQKKI